MSKKKISDRLLPTPTRNSDHRTRFKQRGRSLRCAMEEAGQVTSAPYSQQAFLVNPRVMPGSERARRMTAGSGRKLSAYLTQSGPLDGV